MYPYPVSNSVPGQQGKYRGAKGEQGWEGHFGLPSASWPVKLELNCLPSTHRFTSPPALRPTPASFSPSNDAGCCCCCWPTPGGCHTLLLLHPLQPPAVPRPACHDAAHGTLPFTGIEPTPEAQPEEGSGVTLSGASQLWDWQCPACLCWDRILVTKHWSLALFFPESRP